MRSLCVSVMWVALGLGLGNTVSAQDLPAICARGAVAEPIPPSHWLQGEVMDYFTTLGERTDYDLFEPDDITDAQAVAAAYTLAQAIEWPGVLADRAAELPKAAHDLPWLALLAYIETQPGDPIWALTQGPESILTPDLLPLMERNGLTAEAQVLRTAMALFPEWGLNPADRLRQVVSTDGEVVDEVLMANLEAATRAWPAERAGATAAAMRLIGQVPDLQSDVDRYLAGLSDDQRLDYLLQLLNGKCATSWWTPEEGDRALARIGSAQAALILMDTLTYTMETPSLYAWFDDPNAAHSGALARVFARMNEPVVAKALTDGMDLFPTPFPRSMEARWDAFRTFDSDGLAKIDSLLPDDAYDRIRRTMLALARDANLLPK